MSKRVALVTGGIGGIGTEICKALADQNREVVAVHLESEQAHADKWVAQRQEEGYVLHARAADVSDFDATEKMLAQVRQKFGAITVLINCAGITRDAMLKKMERQQWESVISTNLGSLFNVTQQVLNDMLESGFGRVVNISSVNGQKGQFGQTNYSAAKAGVHGFTMALAQEVASKGITVNTVAPGYVKTRMTDAIREDIRQQIVESIPLGRMATPVEIASAVAFLASDENAYITGARLPVNGGMYMS